MNVRWKFQSTNTRSCVRQPDGSMSCTDDHPNGFEWCINAAAVDRNGSGVRRAAACVQLRRTAALGGDVCLPACK